MVDKITCQDCGQRIKPNKKHTKEDCDWYKYQYLKLPNPNNIIENVVKEMKDDFNIEEIKEEYFRLRELGDKPHKQAELGGIMYGYEKGLQHSQSHGDKK